MDPGELFARELNSVRMSSGGGAHGWEPPSDEEVARLFPQYAMLGLLGRGGMGAVFKARQIAIDRLVAIKLLPIEVSIDRDFVTHVRETLKVSLTFTAPLSIIAPVLPKIPFISYFFSLFLEIYHSQW